MTQRLTLSPNARRAGMGTLVLRLLGAAVFLGAVIFSIQSCAPSQEILEKSGSQLWSENCGRCHNAPPSSTYTNAQWHVIGIHMRERARLTDEEVKKIVTFLQSAND